MTESLTPEQPVPETPFVGLIPYGEGDAAFFFGRDGEKGIIAANLRASRLTILYGASGVGKTSVLHAGVVHDLREQVRANAAGRTARTPFAVCAFSTWRGDPLPGTASRISGWLLVEYGGQWPYEPLDATVFAGGLRERPQRLGHRLPPGK